MTETPWFGEAVALATSLSWAICSLGFALASRRVGAAAVNQIRIQIALVVLLIAHFATFGVWFPELAGERVGWLVASGVAGLAVGDLFYFHAIGVLGPRVGSVLMALAPPMCALIAWPALGETLVPAAWVGIAMTMGGVLVVISDPAGEPGWRGTPEPRALAWALVAGLLGALGQAGGLVLSKLGMVGVDGEVVVAPLSATLVRMAAAAVAMLAFGVVTRRIVQARRALGDGRAMAPLLLGVTFGPTLGVWMSMVAVSHAKAGVAAALMALQPVMVIPIARLAYGAQMGTRAVLGALIAVAGAAVLFLR